MDGEEVVSVVKAAVCRMTNEVDASSFLFSINHHKFITTAPIGG